MYQQADKCYPATASTSLANFLEIRQVQVLVVSSPSAKSWAPNDDW
jgi:hypothetical protein